MIKKAETRRDTQGEAPVTRTRVASGTMRAGVDRGAGTAIDAERITADAALQALERSEASFRRLIESSPEMIYIHREGRVVYVNQVAEVVFGARREELLGTPACDLVHPEDRAAVQAREASVLEGGGPKTAQSARLLRKGGGVSVVENVAVLLEFDGAPATVVIGRDVTERDELHQRLVRADRMASLGTLSAGVAHEINNPLTYVLVNVEHVSRRLRAISALPDDERLLEVEEIPTLLEALGQALEGATRVRQIVRDLMTFARGHVDAKGLVDVRRVLEASLQMTAHEIRHRAKVERRLREVPPVEVNEARLGHVFLSLLVNAAHSIPEGDAARHVVTVTTYATAESQVVIEIGDTGAGIRPEDMGRVFDPFFTTRPAGGGSGLGLSVAHGIVESFGGSLTLESGPGRGTVARVTLPAAPGYAELARRQSTPSPPLNYVPRRRVLVVDDDSRVADAIALSLRDEHDVEVCTDATDALERFQTGQRYDVILCDLLMPQLTGMDFYREVLRVAPQLASRIVFMSGGAFTPRARAFIEGLPNRCIEKPPEIHKLREIVRRRGA